MDAVNENMIYLNWSRYYSQYGAEETFALMDMIEKWAAEDPNDVRIGYVIRWSAGLDGAFSEYYSGILARLYDLAPSEFARVCLSNANDEQEEQTIFMLAYHWNLSVEDVRIKLEAQIPEN